MKFTKEFLSEMMIGGWEVDADNKPPYDKPCELVREEIVGTGRWEIITRYIFKYDGHFYTFRFWRGATEDQDYDQWSQFGGEMNWQEEVEVEEVEPYEKMVIDYRPVQHDDQPIPVGTHVVEVGGSKVIVKDKK